MIILYITDDRFNAMRKYFFILLIIFIGCNTPQISKNEIEKKLKKSLKEKQGYTMKSISLVNMGGGSYVGTSTDNNGKEYSISVTVDNEGDFFYFCIPMNPTNNLNIPSSEFEKSVQTNVNNTIYNIDQIIPLKNHSLRIISIKDKAKPYSEFNAPILGNKLFKVEVSLSNNETNTEAVNYDETDFTLQDKFNFKYEAEWFSKSPGDLGSGSLNPGQKVRGWINFEVPDTTSPSLLIYTYKDDIFNTEQVLINLK